ncbi:beta-ketoacyl-ACP synthase III [Galbibacter sp. EGI 63066]|uniref:beta-ketoacyl-ACP synthase III n=1 Tax=Galbibacter sp. EGI 63066 TaxID=2993559 RepID=UPI0022498FE0|nr:beta-ketoacyl-ACP synthase III [Galbibacter sp. EGI 63066]MCX2678330.1 beta-ketoacyl-ACP synthase III [Galbibacter sp. EGI 63066]
MGNNQPVVYITKVAKFLPNEAVSNDEMEDVLGQINGTSSKARRIVLRNNGIKKRYYALDKEGNATHSNAELTKEAVENLFDDSFTSQDVEVLSCGTSSPDQLAPSHASMVHGLLGNKNLELNSASGVCCAGASSLKFGYLSIKSGNSNNAVCTGSERVSTWMLADKFDGETENLKKLKEQPIIAFKKDFLRWMLSDGAGAMLLENKKSEKGLSLRIDWMEAYSYAHEVETCMYAGGEKQEDGSIKSWSEYPSEEWSKQSLFSVKQDVKILDEYILEKGVDSIKQAFEKHQLDETKINYFLPHISSFYFADKLKALFKESGLNIPDEAWFTNLDRVGNVGSASIYLMLEELMNSGKLKTGETIVLSIPESGRFSYAYVHLTVC